MQSIYRNIMGFLETFRKVRFHSYKWIAILGCVGMVGVIIYYAFIRVIPEAKKTLGVYSSPEYTKVTKASMHVWNSWVGCEFLVPGKDIYVKADDGATCGDPWRPENEWDHAATANLCTEQQPGGHMTEILISHPGNIWSQTWTIAHELGHRIGAEHHPSIGVMAPTPDPNSDKMPLIKIRDADIKVFHKEFCN